MKLKLFVLMLSLLAGQAMAQKKVSKIKATDLADTEWKAIKITRLAFDEEDKDTEIPMEDFGEWGAFLNLKFVDSEKLEGTQLNGKTYDCPFQLHKQKLSYAYTNNDGKYEYGYDITADLLSYSSSQLTLQADFCNDGCNYRILYERKGND